jgi:hypothetical protein
MLMSDAAALGSSTFFNPSTAQPALPATQPARPATQPLAQQPQAPASPVPAGTTPGPLTGHPTSRTPSRVTVPFSTTAAPTSAPSTAADAGTTPAAPAPADEPSTAEIAVDGAQLVLDVTGIVDPTPISDGANALVSLFRGDFKDAAISAAAILPMGDALKGGRIAERFGSLITKAANSPAARTVLEPIVGKLGDLLGEVPIDSLPAPVRSMVESLKSKVDDYLAAKPPATVTPPTTPSVTPPAASAAPGTPGRAATSGAADQPNMRTAMTPRPSWQVSENGATRLPNAHPQQSFLNGNPVHGNPRGSTRPDQYVPGISIESKNYRLSNPSDQGRLVRNVVQQAQARQPHLPAGDIQRVTIDLRGQHVTPAQAQQLKARIQAESGGLIPARHVNFRW